MQWETEDLRGSAPKCGCDSWGGVTHGADLTRSLVRAESLPPLFARTRTREVSDERDNLPGRSLAAAQPPP